MLTWNHFFRKINFDADNHLKSNPCKLDETQLRNSFKETNRKEYAEIVNSSNDTQNKPTEKRKPYTSDKCFYIKS